MHHGEALKSNNDSKAVLGNCTDRALAEKGKKKEEALMHFTLTHSLLSPSLSLCLFFFSLTVGVKSSFSHTDQRIPVLFNLTERAR